MFSGRALQNIIMGQVKLGPFVLRSFNAQRLTPPILNDVGPHQL